MPSREKLAEFAAWCAKHITGDEKDEAQIFLDHLFHGFGPLKNQTNEVFGATPKTARAPQNVIAKIDAVAAAAREVRRVHAEALRNLKGGLRALYRTLELPGANPLKDAHAALDAAVLAAYGFNKPHQTHEPANSG